MKGENDVNAGTLQPLKKEDGKGTSSTLAADNFDVAECRKALARMIIVDELPFKFVEGEKFRYFMSVVQPRFPIPSRIAAAKDCWDILTDEKHKLRSLFERVKAGFEDGREVWR
ncbi:AC transposase, putative [Medicago truncatula]|uniref:AC transposase, putative n=1 Tax=Medicago truncatula TaxID=3880 RepID=A0A072U732_MEDTR|nr:AC transposase, putative [Medicago truncatula]